MLIFELPIYDSRFTISDPAAQKRVELGFDVHWPVGFEAADSFDFFPMGVSFDLIALPLTQGRQQQVRMGVAALEG